MSWYKNYIGKPWARIPNPPHSYTCGELVRAVLRDQLNIKTASIEADPISFIQCVRAMEPEKYELVKIDCAPTEFDIVFLQRSSYKDHVGIAFNSVEGLMILHCTQNVGVVADLPAELVGTGNQLSWYKHKDLL